MRENNKILTDPNKARPNRSQRVKKKKKRGKRGKNVQKLMERRKGKKKRKEKTGYYNITKATLPKHPRPRRAPC